MKSFIQNDVFKRDDSHSPSHGLLAPEQQKKRENNEVRQSLRTLSYETALSTWSHVDSKYCKDKGKKDSSISMKTGSPQDKPWRSE